MSMNSRSIYFGKIINLFINSNKLIKGKNWFISFHSKTIYRFFWKNINIFIECNRSSASSLLQEDIESQFQRVRVWRRGTVSRSFYCRHSWSGSTSRLRSRLSRWRWATLSASMSTFSTKATPSLEITWLSITTSSGAPIILRSISL